MPRPDEDADDTRARHHDHDDADDEHRAADDADGDALGDPVVREQRVFVVEHQ